MLCQEIASHCSDEVKVTSQYFKREFQLSYQPVVSLENRCLHSFEAFVCWQPDRAALYAPDVQALIKQSQLDVPFHHWVLYEACQQMQFWKANCLTDMSLFVSLNVSAKQLFSSSLIEIITRTLDETGLAPAHLQLEIPVSWIMQNWQIASSTIVRLKRIGVSICIDDFDFSQTASKCLDALPIDTLKIDIACVHRQISDRRSKDALYRNIAFAFEKHIQLISKGIETVTHLAPAKAFGFTYGQGDLLSQPLISQRATSIIATYAEQQQKKLRAYLSAMNTLSQFAQHLLGKLLVVKYWQETRPDTPWLALIEPYAAQVLTEEFEQYRYLDIEQEQDLLQWTHEFIQRCSQIIRGFTKLLTRADINLAEKRLLSL